MRVIWICVWLIAAQILAQEAGVSSGAQEEEEFPSELTTKKGVTYRKCKLKRIETDSVLIEHEGGIARVSFFDLDEKFQRKHNFDPIAAMERYKIQQKIQKDVKWKRFWEAQKYRAAVAEEETREKLLETARATWEPVEARVFRSTDDGAFVAASKIAFVPTKATSTLGFEIDGPLRKTLVPMKPNVIFIEGAGIRGGKWEGYLEPFPRGTRTYSSGDKNEVPSYRGVARTQIK